MVETKPFLPSGTTQAGNAESSLRERLAAHPADANAHKQLGDLYFRQSRHEEAEEQFSKALALKPDFAEARWMLAGTFAYRGKWDQALIAVRTLLEPDAENPK